MRLWLTVIVAATAPVVAAFLQWNFGVVVQHYWDTAALVVKALL